MEYIRVIYIFNYKQIGNRMGGVFQCNWTSTTISDFYGLSRNFIFCNILRNINIEYHLFCFFFSLRHTGASTEVHIREKYLSWRIWYGKIAEKNVHARRAHNLGAFICRAGGLFAFELYSVCACNDAMQTIWGAYVWRGEFKPVKILSWKLDGVCHWNWLKFVRKNSKNRVHIVSDWLNNSRFPFMGNQRNGSKLSCTLHSYNGR